MREIKFRGYSKFDACMYYIALERLLDGYKACDFRCMYQDGQIDAVMQYTGLKDKNGKEIYEGDIVKSDMHNPEIFKIEFLEGGFCATYPEGYPTDINHYYSSKGCCIEVIGNIHENPELIESINREQ